MSGLCFPRWDSALLCSSKHIQTRTWKRDQQWKEREKKMDLCKVPGVKFLWNKNLSVLFLFPTSVIVSLFFSDVFVNGHLYVNMEKQEKTRSSTDRWTARKPCWFCFCFFAKGEAERICHDYLLICLYRDFLPAFCMVSGRISFKTRKAGGKTLTVTEKKKTIYWSYLL